MLCLPPRCVDAVPDGLSDNRKSRGVTSVLPLIRPQMQSELGNPIALIRNAHSQQALNEEGL